MIVFVFVFSNERKKKKKTLAVPKCPGLSIKNPHLHYVFHLLVYNQRCHNQVSCENESNQKMPCDSRKRAS